jgi:hypothetical protein
MQLHLFDCKSSTPLRRGLGSNKLSLCMLVLSQLRDTYWSASVIYRLFERAQIMLDKSKSGVSRNPGKLTDTTHLSESQSDGHNFHERQKPHQLNQQQENTDSMRSASESVMPTNDQLFWFNDSASFNNVDQLLSPGFTVPENMFHNLFTGYDHNFDGVYDQVVSGPGSSSIDMLYHI